MCNRNCVCRDPMNCAGCSDQTAEEEKKYTKMEIIKACMACGVDWKDCGADINCPRLKKLLKEMF